MKYSFQFKLFGKKVQMFESGSMGVVIENEPQVVCVYGTTGDHQTILCAVPLCHPKYLKGLEYTVEFSPDQFVKISVGDIRVFLDFGNQKCSNNKGAQCFGSDTWGHDVSLAWDESIQMLFG